MHVGEDLAADEFDHDVWSSYPCCSGGTNGGTGNYLFSYCYFFVLFFSLKFSECEF